jgi:hypothetical protein
MNPALYNLVRFLARVAVRQYLEELHDAGKKPVADIVTKASIGTRNEEVK